MANGNGHIHEPCAYLKSSVYAELFGVPGGNRTHGLSLRRRTLYPTELRKQAILIFFKFYTSIYTSNGSDHNILILCLPKPQYVVVYSGCGCRLGGGCYIHLTTEA